MGILSLPDTWSRADNLASIMKKNASRGGGTANEFAYTIDEYKTFRICLPHESGITTVYFPSDTHGKFLYIVYEGKDARLHELYDDGIRTGPSLNYRDAHYPNFTYVWHGSKRNPANKGSLQQLRVNLTDRIFATYGADTWDTTASSQGLSHLCNKLPNSIRNHPNLLNTEIPCVIDYDAVADKLLQDARLEEFVNALKNAPARGRRQE